MFERASLLRDCIKYPHYLEFLMAVSVNSNYLTDILVRNPEFFYRFVNPDNLKEKLIQENFSKTVNDTISVYKSFHSKVNSLRSLKRREILRIGIKDILGTSEVTEVTSELSILAKVISDKLFTLCYQEVLNKYEIKTLNKMIIKAIYYLMFSFHSPQIMYVFRKCSLNVSQGVLSPVSKKSSFEKTDSFSIGYTSSISPSKGI